MARKKEKLRKKVVNKVKKKIWLWILGLLGISSTTVLLITASVVVTTALIVGAIADEEERQANEIGNEFCTGGSISNNKLQSVFEFNAKGGELEGKGKYIVETAEKYKVPPKIAIAIIAMESGWGKGVNATKQKNPYSIMGNGPLVVYPTIEDGIDAGIKNLYDLYISQGLTTPEKIGPKYAPVGANNDPTNLNSNWIPSVTKTIASLSSDTDEKLVCSSSGGAGTLKGEDIGSPVDPKLLNRVSCKIGDYPGHPGIDIAIDIGTPIYSITDGKVVEAVDGFTVGGLDQSLLTKANHVTVVSKDNPNLYMGYWHLKNGGVKVKKGDEVKAGQLIGLSGNTGFSSGPHLHLHVLKNNVYDIAHAIDWYTPLAKKYNVTGGFGCNI